MHPPPSFVPINISGKPVDISRMHSCDNELSAKALFRNACFKLLHPGSWHKLAGAASAVFAVLRSHSRKTQIPLQRGDFIRIDIPGPGSIAGDGYDWVEVILVERNVVPEADESLGILLKTSGNPQTSDDHTAHFFSHQASSSFVIERSGKNVIVSYFGRNETPNVDNTNWLDSIRNSLVAAGAIAGISHIQWRALAEGLLQED